MRLPFRTETDAFRVAVALALLTGLAILVGSVTSRPYGVVVFAAGIAAGATFELAGREQSRRSSLMQAAHDPHSRRGVDRTRHILVVADETLAGDELADQLAAAGGPDVELDVLAPIVAPASHRWASDVDRERREAEARLRASLAWAGEHGFRARGEVGDADAMTAIEDELRDFGADEIIIATHARGRTSWLARRMVAHLQRELDIPVRAVFVDDRDHPPTTGTGS